jgi:hypothetical protein
MLKPIYKVSEFLAAFSMSRARFYELAKAGKIRTHKSGKFTVVKAEDAQAYLDSLPIREAA